MATRNKPRINRRDYTIICSDSSILDINDIIASIEADELDGYCLNCSESAYNSVEPDARGYECYSCGVRAVFGAQELLFMIEGI